MTKRQWYENRDIVEKLKIEFEKAGLPLEYRARKIFEENGFETSNSHYKIPTDGVLDAFINEKEGTWRQIDIVAIAPIFGDLCIHMAFEGASISLTLDFIGECKFSSNKKFFLFKSRDTFIKNFPSFLWGDNLLPFEFQLFDNEREEFTLHPTRPTDYFEFEIYENIVEVDISNYTNKKDNYDDRITHEACEQLFYAVNYENISAKYDMLDDILGEIYESQLFLKWKNYLAVNDILKEEAIDWRNKISDRIALNFLQNHFELSDIEHSHMIFLRFPILIVNEDAGLFEVVFDDKNNITNFKKIKYGIYNYVSRKSKNPMDRSLYPDSLGILICDISYLNELIKNVIKGFKKLGNDVEQNIENYPLLIGYELLFNPELMSPEALF